MKCKKFDENWFGNKLKQYMSMPTSPEKREQRLISLSHLADREKVNLDKIAKKMYPNQFKNI